MKTDLGEKIILEIKTFFFGRIYFLAKKEGNVAYKSIGPNNIYLTNKRIFAQIFLSKGLDIPLSNILYFNEDEKKWRWRGVRIIYKENNEEKGVILVLKKKDKLKLIEELNKLIKLSA